jgi:hypothetical protein
MNEARENPFFNSVQLKYNTAFPAYPRSVRKGMPEAELRSRSTAVKEKLSEEHGLYRLAFVDNVDRDWGNSPTNPCFLQQMMDRYECIDLRGREGHAVTLVESLPQRMQMVIDSESYWTPY